jgi:hypothetical protein
MKIGVGSGVGSGSISQRYGSGDSGIRIRTKISRIPNTAFNLNAVSDSGRLRNADPDPGQTITSQKVDFKNKIYFMLVKGHKTYLRRHERLF